MGWIGSAGSSKTTPRIFIFSFVLGAEYLFYVKSIEIHARAFLTLNILSIGTVDGKNMNNEKHVIVISDLDIAERSVKLCYFKTCFVGT